MEKQVSFDQILKLTKIDNLSRQDLIQRNSILEGELARVIKENYKLRNLKITDTQMQLILQEQLMKICRLVVEFIEREGRNHSEVARELARRSLKTRTGKTKWDSKTIFNIFNRWKGKL